MKKKVDICKHMKPVVFILIATNNVGGPGKGLFQLIKSFNHSDVEFTLCNFIQHNQDTFEFKEVAERDGIELHLLTQHVQFDPSLIWQAYKLCKSRGCNIIQTHGYKEHIIGLFISRLLRIKWIAVSHGWTSENLKIKLYNKLDSFLLRLPDCVITVSPQLYSRITMLRRKDKYTELIFNAVNTSEINGKVGAIQIRRNLDIAEHQFVIGVYGRFSPEKGHRVLLEAFIQIEKKYPDVVLMFVGNGQEEEMLRSFVMKNNVSNKVKFCGYQQYMRDYYDVADLVVLPSLSEGLPNVVLEAMSLGKVVIATDVGGVREIIKDDYNGWIVAPGNSNVLAEKISKVLANKTILPKMGEISKNSIFPKFSIESRKDNFYQVYNNLLG